MKRADTVPSIARLVICLVIGGCGAGSLSSAASSDPPSVLGPTESEDGDHDDRDHASETGDATPPAALVSSLSSGQSAVCEPAVFTECAPNTSAPGVDETLASPPSGLVTITGTVEETQTRCTKSMPPSCASDLALRDLGGKPRHHLPLVGPPGRQGYGCSDASGCCTLATDGTRYAVTGTLQGSGAAAVLTVESVCRLAGAKG